MFGPFTRVLFEILNRNPIIYGFVKILPIEFSNDVPPAAAASTDGRRIKINPDVWNTLDIASQAFVLAHEAMHLAWDFFGRVQGRDVHKFNIAQDLVINEFLRDNGFNCRALSRSITARTFPKMRFDPQSWTSERVYQWLVDNPDKCPLPGQNILDGCGQPSAEKPLTSEEIQELRLAIQSVLVGAPAGSLPGEIRTLVESAWVPPHDWRSDLSRYFNTLVQDDYSLKRYSVQGLAVRGVIGPTLHSPGLDTLGVIIDTSGSMSSIYDEVLSHLQDILTQVGVRKVIRIDADARVTHEEEVESSALLERGVEFHGNGGTDFREAIDAMEKYNPSVVVYITDGEGGFPSSPPTYPLVWADVSGHSSYPFGDVVRCKE
jgi:predicted metal-dependent peptidase